MSMIKHDKNEHQEVDTDSIRCLSDVAAGISRRMDKVVGHTPTCRAIRYFVSANQGKVTCKIGSQLCVNCSHAFSAIVVPCIYIFKGKQIHMHRESYMSDLGPARSIIYSLN